MWDLCKEFCRDSSVHGLLLVVSKRHSMQERILWGCLVGATAVTVTVYISSLGYMMTHSSVEMIVENPQYNIGLVDFPAVTLCSNSKIMRSKLSKEADRLHLDGEKRKRFFNAVMALDLMKYPFYHHPVYFLTNINHSTFPIPSGSILDIMLRMRPILGDMVQNCKWRGQQKNCVELFQDQATEEGFCYSFNSKSAGEFLNDVSLVSTASNQSLRNDVAGRGSGLSFELKSLDHEQFKESNITRGYSVVVHDPSSYPDVSLKFGVFWQNFSYSRIKVTVSTVRADQSIYSVAEGLRNCKLDNVVSVNSCHFKCRLKAIIKQCGCLPYYVIHKHRQQKVMSPVSKVCLSDLRRLSFMNQCRAGRETNVGNLNGRYDLRGNVEICGLEHLECLSLNNKRLRNAYTAGEEYDVPGWSIPQTMDCTCDTPCSYTTYVAGHEFVPKEELNENLKSSALGSVEVVYKSPFATSYMKRAYFTAEQFLVEVGGVASLFLGCSVLTLVELFIFLCKFTSQLYVKCLSRNNKVIQIRTT